MSNHPQRRDPHASPTLLLLLMPRNVPTSRPSLLRCFSEGLGVAKDMAEAASWYRKAAILGRQ